MNPGQVADLVLAWRQVAGLIALIPHDRPLADDSAYAFRLPPPARAAAVAVRVRPVAKPKAKAKPKAPVRGPASRKAAAKRRTTAKPAPRKRARRGR